jgi:hypothetical protein
MDKAVTDKLFADLNSSLKERFGLDEQQLRSVSAAGQNTLTQTLKSYVMKNGSAEIEQILLGQKAYEVSGLKTEADKDIKTAVNATGIEHPQKEEIGQFALSKAVELLVKSFAASAYSKDLDGICGFIGIDKNLLKMVNSPMGKLFGKFM